MKLQLERKNNYFTYYIIKIFPWVHELIKLVLIYTCTSLDKIEILNRFYVERTGFYLPDSNKLRKLNDIVLINVRRKKKRNLKFLPLLLGNRLATTAASRITDSWGPSTPQGASQRPRHNSSNGRCLL